MTEDPFTRALALCDAAEPENGAHADFAEHFTSDRVRKMLFVMQATYNLCDCYGFTNGAIHKRVDEMLKVQKAIRAALEES